MRAAAAGGIVVLGIRPDRPDTGYGYIRTEGRSRVKAPSRVAAFVEKPDLATAERYLADGGYFWNSGMFVLRASVWLAALGRFRADIATASEAAWRTATADAVVPALRRQGVRRDSRRQHRLRRDGAGEPRRRRATHDVRMVPLDAGWSDLGAWDAVWQVGARDGDGNVAHGDALVRESRNTLVHATSRLVGVIGLDDVTVVETADAVLVAHRSKSPAVKDIVAALAADRAQRGEQPSPRAPARGAGTNRSTRGRASRSSGSWSSRAPSSACRCITTAPSTGSSSRAPPR